MTIFMGIQAALPPNSVQPPPHEVRGHLWQSILGKISKLNLSAVACILGLMSYLKTKCHSLSQTSKTANLGQRTRAVFAGFIELEAVKTLDSDNSTHW